MGNGVVRFSTLTSSGGGGVTSVTGTAPVVSSGGVTPAISMAAATTSVNGYLSSTKYSDFNRKFGGFLYIPIFTDDELYVPSVGEGVVIFNPDGEPSLMRISYTTEDGLSPMGEYLNFNKVGLNLIIITNQIGQTIGFFGTTITDYTTYCEISLGIDVYFSDRASFDDSRACNWTFPQNPELSTINSTSLYGSTNFTTSYAMAGNLQGAAPIVGTFFIGIASSTPNATESNRSVAVASGTVTYIYYSISTAMKGNVTVTLMKNGVATAMTFSIVSGQAAGTYSTTLNQQSVVDGDDLSLRIVQTTATSSSVYDFGFIIT
jgi:hypothetical protein